MNNSPLVTVAFVFRERLSSTLTCLSHLLDNTPDTCELICVDAGSPESIATPLRQLAQTRGFTLIRSDHYLTPNESRNLAMQHVQTPYVVFVDNDVRVGDNWLEPLVRCAEETGAWVVAPLYMQSLRGEERVHMFGGVIRVSDEHGRPVYYEKHKMQYDTLEGSGHLVRQPTDLVEFHTLLMSMEAYRTLGPLDEKLFNISEHADLCLAVKGAGKTIYLEPASIITYQIPDRLEPADRDFFALHWSEAWTQASVARLAEKYAIPLDEKGLREYAMWVRLHRQRVTAGYPRVRAWFGAKAHRLFRRFAGRPLEQWLNLRRYPWSGYVANRTVLARVIRG